MLENNVNHCSRLASGCQVGHTSSFDFMTQSKDAFRHAPSGHTCDVSLLFTWQLVSQGGRLYLLQVQPACCSDWDQQCQARAVSYGRAVNALLLSELSSLVTRHVLFALCPKKTNNVLNGDTVWKEASEDSRQRQWGCEPFVQEKLVSIVIT